MNLTRTQLLILGALGALVLIFALIFLGIVPGLRRGGEAQLAGQIAVWGVFDSRAVWDEVIAEYQRAQPKVQVQYRQLNPETYETELVNALAAGQGPDVLMFHNTWLPKHINKIRPLPEAQFSVSKFRSLFPTVAEQDFAPDGVVYALPLYIDTLAMFYNRDIFDTEAVALPPKTWAELQGLIPKLRKIDPLGRLTRAAAAIGGSARSINRATDLLNLIMLQSGVEMVDRDFTRAAFGSGGLDAVIFYTKFANPANPLYTWNDSFANSVDSFAEGKTAIIFNYSHQSEVLKQKNPFLDFAAAPMLQPSQASVSVNYANYWGLAVSAQSRNPAAAADFASWLTANQSASKKYLELTGKPPALRALISQYGNHPELGIFAKQALTARSWPQIDNNAVEKSFSSMIEKIITGRQTERQALLQAESEITDLMQR